VGAPSSTKILLSRVSYFVLRVFVFGVVIFRVVL
jgi:hypothetical protein